MKRHLVYLFGLLIIVAATLTSCQKNEDLENQIAELTQTLQEFKSDVSETKDPKPETVDISNLENAIADIQSKLELLESIETPEDIDLSGVILSVSKLQGEIETLKSKSGADISGIKSTIEDILERLSVIETTSPDALLAIESRLAKIEESLEKQTEINKPATKGIHNNHEWVDLGTGVLWATCNIGANRPEDYGDYFAWGEITPRTFFKKEYYAFSENPTELPASNDAATQIWGGNWRMPTIEEFAVLIKVCIVKWKANGVLFTSLLTGNSIFLPAAGYNDQGYVNPTTCSYYWSRSLFEDPDHLYVSWYLDLCNDGTCGINIHHRYYGMPIRPVCTPLK